MITRFSTAIFWIVLRHDLDLIKLHQAVLDRVEQKLDGVGYHLHPLDYIKLDVVKERGHEAKNCSTFFSVHLSSSCQKVDDVIYNLMLKRTLDRRLDRELCIPKFLVSKYGFLTDMLLMS